MNAKGLENQSNTPPEAAPQKDENLIKVGELARRTDLTRQALHTYVQLGLLIPARSTVGGQRLFDQKAEERVNLIRKLSASGYSLKDIRDIFLKDPA